MIKKIYKKLSQEQRAKGIIFTSTLSKYTTEQTEDTTHEVFKLKAKDLTKGTAYEEIQKNEEIRETINRLKDDKFFNKSHFKYNIIRE